MQFRRTFKIIEWQLIKINIILIIHFNSEEPLYTAVKLEAAVGNTSPWRTLLRIS